MANEIAELHRELVAAGVPILGVSGNQGSVRVDYDPSATDTQKAQSASLVAGFDWANADRNYLRASAQALGSDTGASNKFMRGVLLTALDQLNTIAAQHGALLTWLGTQTTLTQRAALAGFAVNQITPAQAKAAVVAKIGGGDAD